MRFFTTLYQRFRNWWAFVWDRPYRSVRVEELPDHLAKKTLYIAGEGPHLWFVAIHPFEDGNGRIGRAIAEMCLARSDGSAQRFYSMSSQILDERKDYYETLEQTQSSSLDVTNWLTWFLGCLDRAIEQSNQITSSALEKEQFWKNLRERKVLLNNRQAKVLNKLFIGFEGKLTRGKWMKMTKTSSRTALRDIEELIELGIVEQEEAGGRSTSYRLRKTFG